MKKKYITTLLLIPTLALTLLTFGCDSQGPAEKAGEKVDKTVEATKEAVSDAADKVGEDIDKAAEEVKDAVTPKN